MKALLILLAIAMTNPMIRVCLGAPIPFWVPDGATITKALFSPFAAHTWELGQMLLMALKAAQVGHSGQAGRNLNLMTSSGPPQTKSVRTSLDMSWPDSFGVRGTSLCLV